MLRCKCGGSVRCVDGSEPDPNADSWYEVYECGSCNQKGRLVVRDQGSSLSGCLTTEPSEVRP